MPRVVKLNRELDQFAYNTSSNMGVSKWETADIPERKGLRLDKTTVATRAAKNARHMVL
jgi:hypothetical protein